MKSRTLLLLIIVTCAFVLTSFVVLYPTGAPPAKTGSPGDGSDCTQCHGGTAGNATGWITSNIPADGYTPGQVYQITATNQISGSGKYGFEVSPQNVAGNLLGTLTAGPNTQLVGSNKYVTHTNANTSLNSWTFSWTAPAAGTGQVKFYGAFAKGKPGPVMLSTLTVNEAVISPPPAAGPITGPANVCKNNNYNYSVGVIAGATSYVWSVPAGASIVSGQGTTNISVNFGSSATSGNISVYGTNAGGNGAPSNRMVTVNSLPEAAGLITGESSVCSGDTYTYSIESITNASGYVWSVPPGAEIVAGAGSNVITVDFTEPSSGMVSVYATNSCGSGVSSELMVTVNYVPATPSITLIEYTLTSSPTEGLTWFKDGEIVGSGQEHQVTATGNYWAQGFNMQVGGCPSDTSNNIYVVYNVGFDDISGLRKAEVYPNPSNGRFVIQPNRNSENLDLRILNTAGKEVYQGRIDGNKSVQMDLPLMSGIYLLTLSDGSRVEKLKLFIQ